MFICPYSNRSLPRACEVESCSFNLDGTKISSVYHRCFLFYLQSLRYNPNYHEKDQNTGSSSTPEINFLDLPVKQRTEVVANFMNANVDEVRQANADFYTSLFSVMAQDTLVNLRKAQSDPILYTQCCVCGCEEPLWFPKGGALPDGWGYCSYKCYQCKPPPVLSLERILEVDFADLMKNFDIEPIQNRAHFVRSLANWVLDGISMI